jgi:MFS family permease
MQDVQISLVMGIATAIDFALFFSSGQVMDRWGRRWSAVPSMVIMAISPLILCFTHDLATNVAWFIACAMILSAGNGLASGLILTLGADLAPRGNPAPFLGAFRFTVDAGSSVAPLAITAITAVVSISVAAGARMPVRTEHTGISEHPSTLVHAPPGGRQSFNIFGGEGYSEPTPAPAAAPVTATA